jgi:hypothetical protein
MKIKQVNGENETRNGENGTSKRKRIKLKRNLILVE